MSTVASHPILAALSRALAAVCFAVVALAAAAAPAAAHGRGTDASNYDSEITGTPGLDGVTWTIYGNDEFLSVRNTSDTEIVVLGYQEEPYLRVGPDGVFENVNSEATYLNTDRYAQVAPPADADPDAAPEWRQVSDDNRALWHDHRIHWMSTDLPPQVGNTSERTLILEWTVPFTQGDQAPVQVQGTLTWVPTPPIWPWLLVGLLVSAPALLGLRRTATDDGGRALARPAAAVVGGVALLNVIHLADDLFAVPLALPTIALAALQTVLFLALGAFGAIRAWRGGDGAFTALGVGSGALFVGQGLLYASVLFASQTASVFPEFLTRFVIALTLMQIIPVMIVAVIGTRRHASLAAQRAGEGEAVTT